MKISCDNICKRLITVLPLHRVFHGIRFKVNKIGTRRSPFFYVLTFLTFLRCSALACPKRQTYSVSPCKHRNYGSHLAI